MSQLDDATVFFESLISRRSIRRYERRPVPKEIIRRLLEAATWAPSAHNRQPWRFTVLIDDEEKERLAIRMGERLRQDLTVDGLAMDLIDADVNRSIKRVGGAPVVIVVSLSMEDMDGYPDAKRQKNEWQMAVQSTAMAGQNLLLCAHAFGLGACWMCAPLFCQDAVQDELNLPPSWQPQGLVTLGYAAVQKTKSRRPLREVISNWNQITDD